MTYYQVPFNDRNGTLLMGTHSRYSDGGQAIGVLILWLVWKEHPGVVICSVFWLSAIWMIRSKNLLRHAAGLALLLGVVLNAAVTELNGGVMPVVGMPTHFRAASPIWQAAQTSNHLLFLADHASLHFFSIGDLILIAGISMFFFAKLYQKLPQRVGNSKGCLPRKHPEPNTGLQEIGDKYRADSVSRSYSAIS